MALVRWRLKHRFGTALTNLADCDPAQAARQQEIRQSLAPISDVYQEGDALPYVYELQMPFDSQETAEDLFEQQDLFDLNSVDKTLLRDVAQGRAILLINNCREAWMEPQFIKKVTDYFQHHGVDISDVIYLSNAANCQDLYDGAMKVEHVPIFARDYCDFYSPEVLDHLQDPALRTMSHSYLCYNFNHHPQRVLLIAALGRDGLLGRGLVSMPSMGYRGSYLSAFKDYEPLAQQLDLTLEHAAQAAQHLPLCLEPGFGRHKQDSSTRAPQQYQDTTVSLVTETFFFRREIHLTEKIYKPISFMHPFVLMATPGSLAWLQQQGFMTFGDFWDEGYDSIQDHAKRFNSILTVIKYIDTWTASDRQEFLDKVWPRLLSNRQRLLAFAKNNLYQQQFLSRYGS